MIIKNLLLVIVKLDIMIIYYKIYLKIINLL